MSLQEIDDRITMIILLGDEHTLSGLGALETILTSVKWSAAYRETARSLLNRIHTERMKQCLRN